MRWACAGKHAREDRSRIGREPTRPRPAVRPQHTRPKRREETCQRPEPWRIGAAAVPDNNGRHTHRHCFCAEDKRMRPCRKVTRRHNCFYAHEARPQRRSPKRATSHKNELYRRVGKCAGAPDKKEPRGRNEDALRLFSCSLLAEIYRLRAPRSQSVFGNAGGSLLFARRRRAGPATAAR